MASNKSRQPTSREASAPHYWHLAEDSVGVAMTDLEYAILRVFEAFGRWQSECLTAVSGARITGPENVLLHVIGMKGRAKTIHDVMLLTNRQDTQNVQYGLRKLIQTHQTIARGRFFRAGGAVGNALRGVPLRGAGQRTNQKRRVLSGPERSQCMNGRGPNSPIRTLQHFEDGGPGGAGSPRSARAPAGRLARRGEVPATARQIAWWLPPPSPVRGPAAIRALAGPCPCR